jgi:hypothetical protein
MPRTESMSDPGASGLAAFDADLERLLDVEPSPEFVARVRTRIAAERAGRDWRMTRLAVSLAAAAALILALVLRSGPAMQEGRPPAAMSHHDIQLPNPEAPPAPASSVQAVPHTPRPRAGAPHPASEPDVIIDPSLSAAIRRLTIASRSNTLDPAAPEVSAPVTREPDALAVAEPLLVPELVLPPADQAAVR